MTKKRQVPITLKPKVEDIVQELRLVKSGNSIVEISYNAAINMLVEEALKARKLL